MQPESKSVYLETTIVSYLASRRSRDLIIAARQQVTHDWWDRRRERFDLYISQFVLDEASDGDTEAAEQRLQYLGGLVLLETNDAATDIGQALIDSGVLPTNAATDALHLAMATVHDIDVLLTWNCKHLANAELLGSVGRVVRSLGYDPPIVCTPDELMGE